MKKIVSVLFVGLSLGLPIFADQKLTYQCSNEELTVTFNQVFSTQQASLMIKHSDENIGCMFLSNQSGLSIRGDGVLTIVTSLRPNALLSKFTMTNVIDPSESYSATLILNENGQERTIEFSDCNVRSRPAKIARPAHHPEIHHAGGMR